MTIVMTMMTITTMMRSMTMVMIRSSDTGLLAQLLPELAPIDFVQ